MSAELTNFAQGIGGAADGSTILTILGVAVIFLIVIRFMDLNEKESFGAVVTVLAVGAVFGAVLQFTLSTTIQLENVMGPIILTAGIFAAVLVGLLLVGSATRSKGWAAMGSLMDGVVYGTTAGLGVALGSVIVEQFNAGGAVTEAFGAANNIGATALAGLALGLFGAIVGAGFGAGVSGSAGKRSGAVVGGLLVAAVLHILYVTYSRGDSLAGGSGGYTKALVSLVIPVIFVVVVIAYALLRERIAIRENLADEAAAGTVTADELRLLESFAARRVLYAKTFFSGNFAKWRALRTLHNRQIQLALAEARTAKETDAGRKAKVQSEIERLRTAIADARVQVSGGAS